MKNAVMGRIILSALAGAALLTGCSSVQESGAADTRAPSEAASTLASAAAQEPAEVSEAEYREMEPGKAEVNIIEDADEDAFTKAMASRLTQYLVSNQFSEENISTTQSQRADILNEIQDIIEAGSDLLIADCSEPGNAREITDAAVGAGIPLIYFGTEPSDTEQARWKENGWKVTYVGPDDSGTARLRMDILGNSEADGPDFNEDGTVGVITVSAADDEAGAGVNADTVNEMKEAGLKIRELDEITVENDRDAAKTEIEELLDSYGSDLEVILCGDDLLALGAADAVDGNGSTAGHEVYIIGSGASQESLEEVIAGNILGTVAQDILTQAGNAAAAGRSFLLGENADYQILSPGVAVTKDNAQEIMDVLADS